MREGVLLVQPDNAAILYASPRFVQMLGYDTPDPLHGRPIESLAPSGPFSPRLTRDFIAHGLSQCPYWSGEVQFLSRCREIVHATVNITSLECPTHGRVWLIVSQAIDESRRTSLTLSDFQAKWDSLVGHVPDYISVLNRQAVILYCNRVMPPLRPQDIAGHPIYEFMPEHEQEKAREAVGEVLETGEATSFEIWTKVPDGILRWFLVRLAPVRQQGQTVGMLLIATDITDRRLREDELKENVARFRLLTEASADVITRYHPDGSTHYVSPAVARLLGYAPEELLGRLIYDFVHPADIATLDAAHQAILQGDGPETITCRIRHKDGRYLWFESKPSRILDPHTGELIGIHTISRDISQRRAEEEDFARRQEELAHVWRLSAMGEMAAGLAHEITQPLTAIATYLESALNRLDSAAAPAMDSRQDMQGAVSEALRAGQIIRDLLHFARRSEAHHAPVDLNAQVHQAARLLETKARSFGVALDLQLADNLPAPVGNAVQILQVIFNLMSNGLEAINTLPPEASPERRRLLVETRQESAEQVLVAVHDRGVGLPPGDEDAVFQPFFTTRPSGMGIGLSISRAIINSHGGRLWPTPRKGGGATFTFTLPLTRQQDPADQAGA